MHVCLSLCTARGGFAGGSGGVCSGGSGVSRGHAAGALVVASRAAAGGVLVMVVVAVGEGGGILPVLHDMMPLLGIAKQVILAPLEAVAQFLAKEFSIEYPAASPVASWVRRWFFFGSL